MTHRPLLLRLAAVALAVAAVGCSGGPSGPTGSATSGAVPDGDVDRVPDQVVRADAAALSPDGGSLAAGCLDDVCVWDTSDGSLRSTFPGGSLLAWSPDGDLLATSERDGTHETISLLSADDGTLVRTLAGHPAGEPNEDPAQGISTLTFNPDGSVLASAGFDGTVRLWSVDDGGSLYVLETGSPAPDQLSFSPDGDRVAVAGPDSPVELWDVDSGNRVGTLGSDSQGTVGFSPDGRLLATATREPGDDATVRLWDAADLNEDRTYPGPVQTYRLAFSPDGTTLALTQKGDGDVLLWQVGGDGVQRLTGNDEPPRSLLWAPDGSTLYTVSGSEGVLAWNPASGDLERRFDLPPG